MVRVNASERKAIWLGDSLKNLCSFQSDVQDELGHMLSQVQRGEMPDDVTILPEFGSNVIELKDDYHTDTYRLICVIGLKKGIYVLHSFIKKSKSGKSIPKQDKEVVLRRLKRAIAFDAQG